MLTLGALYAALGASYAAFTNFLLIMMIIKHISYKLRIKIYLTIQ